MCLPEVDLWQGYGEMLDVGVIDVRERLASFEGKCKPIARAKAVRLLGSPACDA